MTENDKPVNSVIHTGCCNTAELCIRQWLDWGSLGALAQREFNRHINDIKIHLQLQLPRYVKSFWLEVARRKPDLYSFLVDNIL